MENNYPAWLFIETTAKGKEVKHIDEPMFCKVFNEKYRVIRIKGIFYLDGKETSEDEVKKLIQNEIQDHIIERTGRKTNDLLLSVQNNAVTKQPKPDERKIYCAGNITLNVNYDGTFTPVNEETFTLTRLAAEYNPDATCPTFMKYLDELLYPEDIVTVQEFIGYCLVPSTKAQAGLFLNGNGGEGKSILGTTIMNLFGRAAVQTEVHKFTDRFELANLEYKLVAVDDDLRTERLSNTDVFKRVITADSPMLVEHKGKDKYSAYIRCRIIGLGNSFIGSKFDHSDGFYRRQLLIQVKPKTRREKDDDAFLADKITHELSGVLNWALEGLSRLINNGFHFTRSERMKNLVSDVKLDNDATIGFFTDEGYIQEGDFTDDITSADLWRVYALWCHDNAITPIKKQSFMTRAGMRWKDKKATKVSRYNSVTKEHDRVNGYFEIKFTPEIVKRLEYMNDKERERIDHMP